MKKTVSRSFLIAACAVPAIRVWLAVFVAEPTLVSPSLPNAYSQIGATAIGNAVLFTLIGVALIAGLAWLAAWRVGKESVWALERPYSIWSTLKWSLLLVVFTNVVLHLATTAIKTKIGRLVPSYYNETPSELPFWRDPLAILVQVGLPISLLMFLISVVVVVAHKLYAARQQRRT